MRRRNHWRRLRRNHWRRRRRRLRRHDRQRTPVRQVLRVLRRLDHLDELLGVAVQALKRVEDAMKVTDAMILADDDDASKAGNATAMLTGNERRRRVKIPQHESFVHRLKIKRN